MRAMVAMGAALAMMAACSATNLGSGGEPRDGGLTDVAAPVDSGQLACGDAACGSSDLCVKPPCSCIVVGDGGSSCPPPHCAAPTPAAPISCSGAEVDGGITGTFTSTVDAGSRRCYQICI